MIELATAADAESLASLCGQLGYPSTTAQVVQRLSEMSDDHRVWVARDGDRLLGWIHAYVVRHLVIDPQVEIGGLVVAEDARGKGVGPRLIEEASAWARAQGIASLGVHSNVVREDAHRFYAREGFVLEKRQGVFTRKVS